jgi:hypothetical protein
MFLIIFNYLIFRKKASKYGHKKVVEAILKRIQVEKNILAEYAITARKKITGKDGIHTYDVEKYFKLMINDVDKYNKTALIHGILLHFKFSALVIMINIAAENKHSEIVNMLLKQGADRTLVDNQNRNALIYGNLIC